MLQYFQLSHQQVVAEQVAEAQIQVQPAVQAEAVQAGQVVQEMQAEQVILHQFHHLKEIMAAQVIQANHQEAAVVPVL